MAFPLFGGGGNKMYRDPESLEDTPLLPGISKTENMLRWGFIKKVYGIIATQLVLTAVVAYSIASSSSAVQFLAQSPGLLIGLSVLSLVGLIPLYCYKDHHPVNLILLGLWTAAISVSVGMICSTYTTGVVIEAVAVTGAIVFGLTAYSFYATRKGVELSFLGPFLFASLWGLIIWGFLQAFFPMGPLGQSVFALVGALIFAGYIVFDTWLLISRFDLDDYVWASITLYLDIINLFLRILQLLGNQRN